MWRGLASPKLLCYPKAVNLGESLEHRISIVRKDPYPARTSMLGNYRNVDAKNYEVQIHSGRQKRGNRLGDARWIIELMLESVMGSNEIRM